MSQIEVKNRPGKKYLDGIKAQDEQRKTQMSQVSKKTVAKIVAATIGTLLLIIAIMYAGWEARGWYENGINSRVESATTVTTVKKQ